MAKIETAHARAVREAEDKASGTDAQQASAGIQQLNQALQSGVLRGDEYNSVAENLPVVARAIAKGLGVTAGKLREMAADGALDAKTVFDAFLRGSTDLDAQAAKTLATFGQAMQNMTTALTIAIGKFDDSTGASQGFADAVTNVVAPAIVGLGDVMGTNNEKIKEFSDWLGRVSGLRSVGDGLRNIAADMAIDTDPLLQAFVDAQRKIREARGALKQDFNGIADDFSKAMLALQASGEQDIAGGLSVAFVKLQAKIASGTVEAKDFDAIIAALADTGDATADKLAGQLELIQAKFGDAGKSVTQAFEDAGKALADAFGTSALGIIDTLIDKIGNQLPASVGQFGAALREAVKLAAIPEADRPTIPLPVTAPVPTPVEERYGLLPGQSRDPAVEKARQASADKLKQAAEEAAEKLNDAIARQTATAVDAAVMLLGKNENTDSGTINAFLKRGGVDLDAATTAWCAGFVNSALAQVGVKGSGSNVATDFLNWGVKVDQSQIQRGDVLVDSNGQGAGQTGGHVGFATGQLRVTADGIAQIEVLSGNASDSVQTDWVNASELVARRATDAFQVPADALSHLTDESKAAKVAVDAQAQAYEQLGKIAGSALEGIADALADGKITGQELIGILADVAKQLLSMPAWPSAGAGGAAPAGGGNFLTSLLSAFLGGFAGGGWPGGKVRGPGGSRGDKILARLSDGEHVTNARSARKYRPLLDAINADRMPRFADGGSVGVAIPQINTMRIPQQQSRSQEITLRVIGEEGPMFRPTIQAESRGVAVHVVRQGLGQYDREAKRTFAGRMAEAQVRDF